ncbi:uncharacterized protein LOC105647985 [Jatropha curcas]|uniref:uncharacterized protein LOC105647985 n=1 Tax=Jatropha curcas TaxID=180498 RepID=UPI0005FA9D81|nr:uncharacterized protein LOC105647985 [Jatropha curcas]
MASIPPIGEDPCNTETDEETIALRKKRSRRVSFADREITSVHIFKRDDDSETPPDSFGKNPSSGNVSDAENEVIGFFRDLADSDDSKEMTPTRDGYDDNDDVGSVGKSFLRPIGSPSPGSSIVASATSNEEEDNFFGPVSASFIRRGQLSDSAASDDNHDITMDSTAFSMHYRSLARSDSGVNAFEEKTPTRITTPSDSGSFMVLTKAKKLIPQVSLHAERASGSNDSNHMSLIGENPRNYDYGRLSPTLEALLAAGSKDLHDVSVSDSMDKKSLKRSEVYTFNENSSGHVDSRDHREEACNVGNLDIYTEHVPAASMELNKVNCVSLTALVDQITNGCTSHRTESLAADTSVDKQMRTPNQLSKVNNDNAKAVIRMNLMNTEFPADSGGTSRGMNGKALQLNSYAQTESRKNSNNGCSEQTPNNRSGNYGFYHNSDQQHRSPLTGSISLVSAKQRLVFLDTAQSSKQLSYVTPSPKQSGSFFGKENMRSAENLFPIHKSSSNVKIFEPSPLSYSLKDGIEKSKVRLLKHLSSTTPFNAVTEESCKVIESKNVDSLVTNLEKQILSQKNKQHDSTDYMDSVGVGTPEINDMSGKNEEVISLTKDGESLIPISTHILPKERDSQLMTEVDSPSQFTWSLKKVQQDVLMPEKFKQQRMTVFGSDSPSIEVNLGYKNDVKTSSPLDRFISPPAKTLDQKLSSSKEHKDTASHDLQYNDISIGLGQDKISIDNVNSNNHSTAVTDGSESGFAEVRTQSSSSLIEINHFEGSNQMEKLHDKRIFPSDLQHVSETLLYFGSPLRERNNLKILSGSPDKNVLFTSEQIYFEEELAGVRNDASLPASASPNRRNMNEPSFLKSPFMKDMTQSPHKKKLHDVSNGENVQSLAGKEILSPNSNSSGPGDTDSHLDLQVSQSQIPAQYIKNSSLKKRRIEESVPEDADHADKIRRINQNPDIHRNQGSNAKFKHWSDVLLKFSGDTQQLLFPLVDKLNVNLIVVLQDILVHLQKMKFYEMLCFQIKSQKMCDQSSEVLHKRVAETKMLLYKLAYEKAKQQLMSVKREKVVKNLQQLSSAMQKSQTLKLNRRHLFLRHDRHKTVDNLSNSCGVTLGGKHVGSREKVATMKHEFEALDRKIKNITKSFHNYCKIKGEPSCSETIVLLGDHLKKKTTRRFIHKNLQLWEVDDSGNRNGKQIINLNYQGLICQRFAINDGHSPCIYVSNILNNIIIAKNFPNMEACVAFACILNANTSKKCVGFRSFAQETQITSSLLHNLLDVVGEVQLAQVEIRNLVQTSFCSSSVEQLDLQLCFIDFDNGQKLMVTLDMTCLNCGIYPSDIFPYQLKACIAGTYMSLPESLSVKIKTAVNSVGVGYSRIIRLCRCISQVVQST